MKIKSFLICLVGIIISHSAVFAGAPHELAGFALGKKISEYADKVRMDTVLPIRYAEFLKEVEIKDMEGYKSGLIVFGECADPGRIVRIKLKYADPSKRFYDLLLEKFKKRFGTPDKWRGDPFHVVVAWKWSFKDKAGNNISLILQHNTQDATEKMGNVVKLAMLNLEEEEFDCFAARHPAEAKPDKKDIQALTPPLNWERFLPR